MATVSMPPASEAKDVFRELGYTVSELETEFVAERKWRRVLVTPMCADAAADPEPTLADDRKTPQLRCFVTWKDTAESLRSHLMDIKPPYDWAVIGVDSNSDFEVMQGAPGSP